MKTFCFELTADRNPRLSSIDYLIIIFKDDSAYACLPTGRKLLRTKREWYGLMIWSLAGVRILRALNDRIFIEDEIEQYLLQRRRNG